MKSIGEALRQLVSRFEPLGTEKQPLLSAVGRNLAEDVFARGDLPPFDNSAMDGYAIRRAEVVIGACMPVRGESRAGGATPAPLASGTATRIFTGAPIPEGADTVVIQEHTRLLNEGVVFEHLPSIAANIRKRGSDLAAGKLAVSACTTLAPGDIALIAAQGTSQVRVYRRPRVAVLSTGDELRDIEDIDAPGTIINTNAYALCAQIALLGCEPWMLPAVKDRRELITAAILEALQADVVLCTGGVSVGEYDVVAQACQDAGVEVLFWKVAIKPGKPLLFGMAGRVPVLGLPGNPVSAMVAFEVFAKPGLLRMCGAPAPYPTLLRVELLHEHQRSAGRVEFARAQLLRAADGRLLARMHPRQGSGSLPSMAGVDALIVLDAETEHFAAGSQLDALLLRALPGQIEPPFA